MNSNTTQNEQVCSPARNTSNEYGLAPIVIFCYNRVDCLKAVITSLLKNSLAEQSDLIFFFDGPKNDLDAQKVQAVRQYLNGVSGFRSIEYHSAEKNQGLGKSIIAGVSDVVSRYGRVIVLEDDIVVAPYFLQWMNDALELYQNEERVAGIHAWSPPSLCGPRPETYFIREVGCLGWATWKRGWDIFEPDGKKLLQQFTSRKMIREFNIGNTYPYFKLLENQTKGMVDSWAIRWYASVFLADKLGLQPGRSLVSHIGYSSGTHFNQTSSMPADEISAQPPLLTVLPCECNDLVLKTVYRKYNRLTVPQGLLHFVRRVLRKALTLLSIRYHSEKK